MGHDEVCKALSGALTAAGGRAEKASEAGQDEGAQQALLLPGPTARPPSTPKLPHSSSPRPRQM